MEEEKNKMVCGLEKVKTIVSKELEQFSATELNQDALDTLSMLVDIVKDLENIDYWNVKKEVMKMRYNDYDDYAEERYGNYERRGVPGTGRGGYRDHHDEGERMLDDMKESYSTYSESMDAYNRGNYNAGHDGMRALEDAMELFTEFSQKMIREAESPEAKQIIKKHLRKISQMSDM